MVSIIILSYNTKDLLKNCLESIYKNLKGFDFEVIVVDNASSDSSVQMVESNFKEVVLVESKKNLGFSAGNNLGAKYAKGKYLLFLNSDIEIKSNEISKMVKFLENNKDVGIVGGNLKNLDGSTQRSYGRFYYLTPLFLLFFAVEDRTFKFKKLNKVKKVGWVSGAFMLIYNDLFQKIKGFDENFFMYIEDMELCYRVRKMGYTICFFPEATALHINQGSSNRSFAIVNIYKGLLYFYKKHKSWFSYFMMKLFLVLKARLSIFIGLLTHNVCLANTYREALKF